MFDSQAGVDEPMRSRGVGMVFQHGALFPHMTVLENVAFAAASADDAERLLDDVGAGAWHDRHPGQLSGGERQRVALARALAARPRALLLDEPFSALDRDARSRLAALLARLQRETGVPFLHVTHDLAEALHLGDHLIQLDGGRVAARDLPASCSPARVAREARTCSAPTSSDTTPRPATARSIWAAPGCFAGCSTVRPGAGWCSRCTAGSR